MAAWKNRIISSGMVDPTTLNPNELNWRKHPDRQAKALSGTLDTLGWISDIIVNQQTGRMIDGHLRVELAIKNKEKEVPVKYVDLSPEEEELALLTLDPIGAMAEADKNMLEALLNQCKSDDERIQALMGDIAQDYKIQKKVSEDDYEPPAEIETDIKRGDIFLLGRHRVMCGNAIEKEDIDKLVSSALVGLILMDPPYGISVVGGGGPIKFGKVVGVGWVNSNTYPIVEGDESTTTCKDVMQNLPQTNMIIFGGNYFTDFLPPSRCWIVWDKENTGNFADAELAWTNFEKGVRLYHWLWNGLSRKGDRETEGVKRCHPTQKPVGLFCEILKDFSKDNEIILDPFLGSGTTLIACEQLNRVCYGCEISPQYVEVICQRFEKLTGIMRKKINGVNT